jgi:hypothetical protein
MRLCASRVLLANQFCLQYAGSRYAVGSNRAFLGMTPSLNHGQSRTNSCAPSRRRCFGSQGSRRPASISHAVPIATRAAAQDMSRIALVMAVAQARHVRAPPDQK